MEHRGVQYEIKIAPGRSQWTWVAHTTPKPRQGSVGGLVEQQFLRQRK
jgi:hypothetical protein